MIPLPGAALVVMGLLSWHVHAQGKTFYESRREKCAAPKVYDVGHMILPDRSREKSFRFVHDTILTWGPPVIATIYLRPELSLYSQYWLTIMAIRAAMTALTILPKYKNCDDTAFGWKNAIVGHCYDKIPSGHFAGMLLVTAMLVSKGTLGLPMAVVINGITAAIILSLRNHYTVDLAVSALVVAYVLQR